MFLFIQHHWLTILIALGLGGLAYHQWGWTLGMLIITLEAWFFLAIAIIDLQHRLVLNRMIGPALPILFVTNLLLGTAKLSLLLLGALVGFCLFLFIALVVPGAMGMGDVKLAGLIGATVGFGDVLIALYVAVILGGLAAVVLLLKNPTQRKMAYAPYLVLGTWFVLFNGPSLFQNLWG